MILSDLTISRPAPSLGHPQFRRVWQAIQYIETHYQDCISAVSLSLEVRLSTARLQAGLRQATGCTLSKYHEQVRIEKARSLLAETDYPVKLVARRVGFKTHSHFGEIFKKITSFTPSEYRNLYGQ